MNNNINITMRVDSQLKRQAEDLFTELGLSFSAAFSIFLRQSVREQRIPFEITKVLPNDTTIQAILDASNDSDLVGPFKDLDSLKRSLDE